MGTIKFLQSALTDVLLKKQELSDGVFFQQKDEYLAAIQYHNGSLLVKDINIRDELAQHAKEELNHADWLSERILEMGGKPAHKSKWKKLMICGYARPKGNDQNILHQNIAGERCAIEYYQSVLNKPPHPPYQGGIQKEVDSTTKQLVAKILAQEYEHLNDLLFLLEG